MTIDDTTLPEVKVYVPDVFKDERGFFLESFNQKNFDATFVQDNHSFSSRGVLRGLHYQVIKPQGKLVRVIRGAIFDVAVDIRKSSPNFGKWTGKLLTSDNFKQLWIPPGFAHGFVVLSDKAEVLYKTTEFWHKEHERCIKWNDPALNIDWYIMDYPNISKKDDEAPLLKDAEVFE
jgi:dTDP-4-dehydrorhamnose 3,5-epimerase